MCGFYAAALDQFLTLLEVPSSVRPAGCRAMGHEQLHARASVAARVHESALDAPRTERILT